MQRLGRTAAALLQLQRCVASNAVQQGQRVQCSATSAVCAAQALVLQGNLRQQIQPLHSSAACSCAHHTAAGGRNDESSRIASSSSSSSSEPYVPSSSLHNPWQQYQGLVHTHRHTGSPAGFTNTFSRSSSSSSSRAYASSVSPLQQTDLALSDAAAASDQDQDQGPQLSPAAEPKRIVGQCNRKNLKCGWKKIDFVLRMIRRATVDDAMAQLNANPKRSAVFVKHAVANARNNAIVAGGDPQKLYIAEAFVTKGQYKFRTHFHGRGYASVQTTRYSHLKVRVEQMDDMAAAAVTLRRQPRLIAPIMQRMQDRQQRRPRRLLPKGAGGGSSRQQLSRA